MKLLIHDAYDVPGRSLPSWERGLKFMKKELKRFTFKSLPSWERGLKYFIQWVYEQKWQSLPSWERGLKSFYLLSCLECLNVAPLVGAWIEISLVNIMFFYTSVAPLVGAWIEITCAL